MPTAAKRPCKAIGCGRLVEHGYCEACLGKGRGKDARPSAAKRLYGRAWRKASAAHLASHPLCADPSGVHGELLVAATQTDHIVPHRGDASLFWDENNWQPLCIRCHSTKTAYEYCAFCRG